jgi:hypothetical protein
MGVKVAAMGRFRKILGANRSLGGQALAVIGL